MCRDLLTSWEYIMLIKKILEIPFLQDSKVFIIVSLYILECYIITMSCVELEDIQFYQRKKNLNVL